MRDYWDRAIRPGFTTFGIHSGTAETCADCIPVEPGVPHPSEMGEASHARARADRSFTCDALLRDYDGFTARCMVTRGIEHSHHDYTARASIAMGNEVVDGRGVLFDPDGNEIHTEAHMAQNEDNRAHLAYYDKANEISFVFNQSGGILVSVCPGGYAEPERDTFEWHYDRTTSLDNFLRDFEKVCRSYIEEHYGLPALAAAFAKGLNGVLLRERQVTMSSEMPIMRAWAAGQNLRADLGLNE